MSKKGRPKLSVIFTAICLIAIVMMGCQSWPDKIGSNMDQMAKGLEKFGTVSMSSPILVEASKEPNEGYFDFELDADPNDYYRIARTEVQARAAALDQYIQQSTMGIKVQANITALLSYLAQLRKYAQELGNHQARRALQGQAAELRARKVIADLPENATEPQVLEALAKAAEIRAEVLKEGPPCPAAPEIPSVEGGVVPESDDAGSGLASDNLTPALGLLKDTTDLGISNRSAISTAAGDTITEGIFRLLGNPAKAAQFEDKLMLFGVSMVSVSPGWLTRKNYTAELSVDCDYYYDVARRRLLLELLWNEEEKTDPEKDEQLIALIKAVLNDKPIDKSKVLNEEHKDKGGNPTIREDYIPKRYQKEFREEYAPLSAAVSPMTDVDALDLASSQRRQIAKALQIVAALSHVGLGAQAGFFKEWAKRTEQDIHTRSAYAAVTSFSSGGYFGFRVRPRLKAIENSAILGGGAGSILEQQAFPVVVIIGIDLDDLKLAFDVKRVEDDPNNTPEEYEEGKVRLVAYEPLISFRQTVSWLPNTPSSKSNVRLSEIERLRWAASYLKAHQQLESEWKKAKRQEPDSKSVQINKKVYEFIKNRINVLRYHTLEAWNAQYIPLELMTRKKESD